MEIEIHMFNGSTYTRAAIRSRGTTRRHFLRPQGWKEYVSTAVGNRLARRLAYLWGAHYKVQFVNRIMPFLEVSQEIMRIMVASELSTFSLQCSFWPLQVVWYIQRKDVTLHTCESKNILRLELCHVKGMFYVIEQPISSLLFEYKPIKRLLKRHGARQVRCSLGAFNAPTLKPAFCLQNKPMIIYHTLQDVASYSIFSRITIKLPHQLPYWGNLVAQK